MSFGADYEFFGRAEWRAVQNAYGLVFSERRSVDERGLSPSEVAEEFLDQLLSSR
jgi:glycine betaine/choline ABC-type transport system substrate-binding protein